MNDYKIWFWWYKTLRHILKVFHIWSVCFVECTIIFIFSTWLKFPRQFRHDERQQSVGKVHLYNDIVKHWNFLMGSCKLDHELKGLKQCSRNAQYFQEVKCYGTEFYLCAINWIKTLIGFSKVQLASIRIRWRLLLWRVTAKMARSYKNLFAQVAC